MKQMWRTINSLRKPFANNKNIKLNVNNEMLTDNLAIANKFNNHFIKLPVDLKNNISSNSVHFQCNIDRNSHSFWLSPVNEIEVLGRINSLKDINFHTSSAPPKLIKLVAQKMSLILTKMFNACIASSIFPDILKIARVTPIPKNTECLNICNYRPISILSPFAKIFEKIIYDRLYSFFDEFSLFNDHQYGFVKGKGIQDAIINILYKLNDSINEKHFSLMVFLDFSKAFDMVSHQRLLSKLDIYGIRGDALLFFKSYFTNRKQFVSIGGENSDIKDVTIGVPQGSALGPLFYLIYSNDITRHILGVLPYLYADDTSLLISGNSICDMEMAMNTALEEVFKWSNANELVLNPLKTKVMLFTTKTNQQNLKVYLNGNLIEQVSHFKYLGLWLQDNLKFTKHISELTNTISKSNGVIYSLKNILPLKILKNLYYSFTYPHLLMHILAWGGSLQSHIKPLKIA
jgi:hypothetical protein